MRRESFCNADPSLHTDESEIRCGRILKFVVWLLIVCTVDPTVTIAAGDPDYNTLDRNKNGLIEPNEIPADDRVITARYADFAGVDFTRPIPIKTLKLGRYNYIRRLEGRHAQREIKPAKAGERGFGAIDGKTGVKGFGIAGDSLRGGFGTVGNSSVAITSAEHAQAINTFISFDANRDAFLSREEIRDTPWPAAAAFWFRGDVNGDGRLNLAEMKFYLASKRERDKLEQDRARSTWVMDGVEVTLEHRQGAARLLKNMDKNGNGIVEGQEIPGTWWVDGSVKVMDTNFDRRLTLEELYRGRAMYLKRIADQNAKIEKNNSREIIDRKRCENLAADIFRRYATDKNKNMLRRWNGDWRELGKDMESADINNDGYILKTELSEWLFQRLSSQPGSDLPVNLPAWFVERDVDLDGQVLLSEYRSGNPQAAIDEFRSYDHNNDGIISTEEAGSRSAGGKIRYAGTQPLVIEAGKEAESELFIPDTIKIADIDLYLAIVKNGDDDLELKLVGPSEQIATLYYDARNKPWGGGRLFENTFLDDEAPEIRQRLPRPPAHRSFRPQGMNNREMSSLSAFYGKPARGTWRLVIRNKSRVAGFLQGWALYVKPAIERSRSSGKAR